MMKALIVIAVIVLLIALLMSFSVSVYVSYIDGIPDFKVKYFLFKVFPITKKKSVKRIKSQKNKKKSDKKNNQDNINTEQESSEKSSSDISENPKKEKKSRKSSLPFETEDILELLEMSSDIIKKSAGKVSVRDIYIYFLSCDKDACKCAVNYGIMNGIVYNTLGIICTLFKTTFKSVSIGLRYNKSGNIFDFSFILKLKLGTGVSLALRILINYAKIIYRKKQEENVNE